MTQHSDAFLNALTTLVNTVFPKDFATGFTIFFPVDTLPLRVEMNTHNQRKAETHHDRFAVARFPGLVENLFASGEPGRVWLDNTPLLVEPAADFGFSHGATQGGAEWEHSHQRPDNLQPLMTFELHRAKGHIESVRWTDGTLFGKQNKPLFTNFKTLKSQKELARFLHMLSAFQGPMTLWRTYCSRQSFTVRAPSREAAMFLTYVCINSKKALKSDTYTIEDAWRVFCSRVETDTEIQSHQNAMRALRI